MLKHLSGSHEADASTEPVMLIELSWQQAKERITKAVKSYWEKEISQ